MNENDLELKILSGTPIRFKNICTIYPLTLEEIKEIGELEYNKLISVATFKQDKIELEGRILTSFETLLVACYQDKNFKEYFLYSMKIFLKEDIHFFEDGFFCVGNIEENRLIDNENYEEFCKIIKRQNFMKEQEEDKDEFVPHDDKAKEMIEQLKAYRQKVKESNAESGLNLSDIIAIVATHSGNLNIFNIWNLTVHQLYTIYLGMMMKANYESQYYLLPHVSDSKALDLTHWATKIQK